MGLSTFWAAHGTKALGWFTGVVGGIVAFQDQIMEIWFDERGDKIFKLLVGIMAYMVMGAGAAIVKRGYTNTAVQQALYGTKPEGT